MSLTQLRHLQEKGSRSKVKVKRCLSQQKNGIFTLVENLKSAVISNDDRKMASAMNVLCEKIIADSTLMSELIYCGGFQWIVAVMKGHIASNPTGSRRTTLLTCLHLLLELELGSPKTPIVDQAITDDSFILALFQLMKFPLFFERALAVVEGILLIRPKIFPLASIPNLKELMEGLSCVDLTTFCRVLAVCVFDSDEIGLSMDNPKYSKSVCLIESRRDKRTRSILILEQNHALICSHSLILNRLVTIVRCASFAPSLEVINSEDMMDHMGTTMELMNIMMPEATRASGWDSVVTTLQQASESYATAPRSASASSSTRRNPINALIAPLMSNLHSSNPFAAVTVLALALAPRISEVLFVLTAFLTGRRKLDFQRQIFEAGIIPDLHRTFDRLSWGTLLDRRPVPGHGANCNCDMESSVRIQLLRFILSLLDGPPNLNPYAVDIPKQVMFAAPHGLAPWKAETNFKLKSAESLGNGLMRKLIVVLINEPRGSPYRFWLACCVETYLRGSVTQNQDQLKVTQSGVLDFFILELLKTPREKSEDSAAKRKVSMFNAEKAKEGDEISLQVACDFLGEVCKFNATALRDFDNSLVNMCKTLDVEADAGRAYELLKEVIFANIVDANVLYRSLLLAACDDLLAVNELLISIPLDGPTDKTTEAIRQYPMGSTWRIAAAADDDNNDNDDVVDGIKSLKLENEDNSHLNRAMMLIEDTQVEMLARVVTEVGVPDVSHENLCCINTSIVIFMIAKRQNKLCQLFPQFLKSADEKYLSHKSAAEAIGDKVSLKPPRDNFRELLWFWREYYRHRGQDRRSLFTSSHMAYSEWKAVVDLLCADNGAEFSLLSEPPTTLPISPYLFPAANPDLSRKRFSAE